MKVHREFAHSDNNGGKKAVLFGACGGISPIVQTGDLIIPSFVYTTDASYRQGPEIYSTITILR